MITNRGGCSGGNPHTVVGRIRPGVVLVGVLTLSLFLDASPGARGAPRELAPGPIGDLVANTDIGVSWRPASRGEWMTYAVYLGPLRVGRAAVSVGAPTDRQGRKALRARAKVETTSGLTRLIRYREDLDTTVDLELMVPVRSTLTTQLAGKHKVTVTDYGNIEDRPTRQRIEYQRGKRTIKRVRRIARGHLDPLSVILGLRDSTPRKGQRKRMTLLAGTKVYRLDLHGLGTEKVALAQRGRRMKGFRVDVVATWVHEDGRAVRGKKPTRMTLWLSQDRQRVPLAAMVSSKYGKIGLRLSKRGTPTAGGS